MNTKQAYANVVTYMSPRSEKIDITPDQEKALKTKGKWPKDRSGQEYCSVSMGLHAGGQSDRDRAEIEELLR